MRASWIDFHDQVNNPHGYQRPFEERRSQKAAEYAETVPGAFWPECILAIRDGVEDETGEDDRVTWTFTPTGASHSRFGTLGVTYNPERTTEICGRNVPWRRAFSQVDCQHRLGQMAGSARPVTFCIFPGLSARDEAIIFRTINAKQKGVSTSLVDAIILLTDPDPGPHINWAWQLGLDPGSPFNNEVWTGGRDVPPREQLIRLAGLRQTLQILVPKRVLGDQDPDLWYPWVRNFWNVVKSLWPKEFVGKEKYRLQTASGQRGLAQFGQHIFREVVDSQDIRTGPIRAAFGDPAKIDWSLKGPFELATGKGGQREVYRALVEAYGLPQ